MPDLACRISARFFAGDVLVDLEIGNGTVGPVRLDPARARLTGPAGEVQPHKLWADQRWLHPPPGELTAIPPDAFVVDLPPGGSAARALGFPAWAMSGFSFRVEPGWRRIAFSLPIEISGQARMVEATLEAEGR